MIDANESQRGIEEGDLLNSTPLPVENFSTTAIRGESMYYDSTNTYGPVLLPYGPESYTPQYEGFVPSQNVFTPSYDASAYNAWTPWGF